MFVDLRRAVVLLVIMVVLVQVQPFEDVNPAYVEQIVRLAKAAEMRAYLNESHDPCDNFYNFACGNYYRINPPRYYPFVSNTFETISHALKRKIATVLKPAVDTDTLADMKVKNFYEACMNLSILRTTYVEKLKEIIKEFGRMPALEGDGWREGDFDWLQTVAEIAYKYQIRIILGYHIDTDNVDNTLNRLHIVMQQFPFESKSMYTDEANEIYRAMRKATIAKHLQVFLGLEMELADRTAKEIFDFETQLYVGNKTDIDDFSVFLENLTTVEEMHRKYFPHLDIKRLLNISLGTVLPAGLVYELNAEEANNIINALRNTPMRIVANYIFYYLLEKFMLIQPQARDELGTACINRTKKYFANILDNMVYRKYTTPQAEEDVKLMWKTIKTTFQRVLDSGQLGWMKEPTRQQAQEKLSAMNMEINSYQQIDFIREFEDLTINKHDYVENIKAILMWNGHKSRAKLNEPPRPYDDLDLSFTPAYVLNENLIKVPVSMLQPYYLWSPSYPQALKFATLGFLISHELIHGFDEEGRDFDTAGNHREWWDADSSKYFMESTDCFGGQYHRYVYNGRTLSEYMSQSENIADNGGIRLAYEAYLQWHEQSLHSHRNMDLETMPRLGYTSKQLFFIGYAQLWCSSTHPILRDYVASTDVHVPDKFRVIGPLSNLQEFSAEFKCPIGSGMNPRSKCVIY